MVAVLAAGVTRRLAAGDPAPDFSGATADGGTLAPGDLEGTVLLQFHRFAGCPICNLSLRDFARRQVDLMHAGVSVVQLFHSSPQALAQQVERHGWPFPIVGDPAHEIFDAWGVTRSFWSMLHPGAMLRMLRAMLAGLARPVVPSGGSTGLPADFLLRDGVITYAHYGRHAADSLSVEAVLELVAEVNPIPGN